MANALTLETMMPLWGGVAPWEIDGVGRDLLHVLALNLLWLPIIYLPLRVLAHRARGPRIEWER